MPNHFTSGNGKIESGRIGPLRFGVDGLPNAWALEVFESFAGAVVEVWEEL